MADSHLGKERYKISLELLVITESQEGSYQELEDIGTCLKRFQLAKDIQYKEHAEITF